MRSIKSLIIYIIFFLIVVTMPVFSADTELSELWKYSAGGKLLSSPIITEFGTVYVYAEDRHLHAINAAGEFLWKCRITGTPADSLAAGPDNTIYVCNKEGILNAVNPGGQVIWKVRTGGEPAGDPSIATDGTICVTSKSGTVSLYSHTGRLRWRFESGSSIQAAAIIDTYQGIFISSDTEGIIALSPWGRELWRWKPDNFQSGTVFHLAVHDHRLYFASTAGIIGAFDSFGTLLWSAETGFSYNSLILTDTGMLCSGNGGRLVSINYSGAEIFNKVVNADLNAHPAAGLNGVYFLNGEHKLVLVSYEGRIIASADAEGEVLSQFSLGAGRIVTGTDRWIVYCFRASLPLSGYWAQKGKNALHAGSTVSESYTINENMYRTVIDYVYLSSLLESDSVDQKKKALSEIYERILDDREDRGENYLLPLLYKAMTEGRTRVNTAGGYASSNNYPSVRAEAARLAGYAGNLETIELLVSLLDGEKDGEVRVQMIRALGRLNSDYKGLVLPALYRQIRGDFTGIPDEKIATTTVDAVISIIMYSGVKASGFGLKLLLEISRGPYSSGTRARASDALRRIM